ncbi:hypothetical protein GC194_06780 [bacterium]|nr:hypothetical protein [bacterium]
MNWRNAGILFLVLIVPVLLILLFKTGTTKLERLPVFGERQFENGDSVDYSINLDEICAIPDSVRGSHFLLYFSENEDNILRHDALENLQLIANRLVNAQVHPKNPVKDVYILSVSNKAFEETRPRTWLQLSAKESVETFVKDRLDNGFAKSDKPIEDHLSYLVDKDGRIRSVYFTAHGKFDRDILGELVVLQNEYGH